MPIRPLSKCLQEKAATELNEIPPRIENDIQQVRNWLEKQPHLHARTDDQWLLNFLRCSKFSIERTKERLDLFYTMRTLAPELYRNRNPMLPEIQDILKRRILVPLPWPVSIGGPAMFFIRWKNADPEKNSYIDLLKTISMMADVLLQENDNFSVVGVLGIEDMTDTPFNYILQLTPAVCKKTIMAIQNTYPIRVKGIHFINVPSFGERIYNLFKPFLSEKVQSKIKLYERSEIDDLFKHVPRSALPEEYGGESGSLDVFADQWKQKLESYQDWFLEDGLYCSDETKRPGNPRTSSELFGIEGSFRKLSID